MNPQNLHLRAANMEDAPVIWQIFQLAIAQRKRDGSKQWQNNYPNENTVREDIEKEYCFVLTENDQVVACAAVIFEPEPAYNKIDGAWLTHGDYAVIHRLALSDAVKGRGLAARFFELIEKFVISRGVPSIKIDTFFDNAPMLRLMEKLDYVYCGEVFFNGAVCKAFEKLLK
ncbi:MAG TPA: GNAT family N-acetyltransferase [Cyclobacteriaceae bacterium]|nr:GNAT family N-acetyltransferase [Cyclobacteriaceae bacterium]